MSYLAKMQVGTPFLQRQVIGGKEHMQICLFWIHLDQKDPGASALKWRAQESSEAQAFEVPIGNIVAVEGSGSDRNEEDIGSLNVIFRVNGETQSMELIVASREDFQTWRDGLRFIVDAASSISPSPTGQSRIAAKTKAALERKAKNTSISPTSAASAESAAADILQRCRLQAELISELRQENQMLNCMMKQKDDAIAQLTKELKSVGTKADRCNKTELTSRESDDHLKDRHNTILKRNNQRLRKLVEKKQKTIKNLMQALQSALGNQTSDGELLKTEDEGDDVDSDVDIDASINSTLRSQTLVGSKRATSAKADLVSDGSGSDDIMMNEEVRALASKLAFMEQTVAGLQLQEASPPQISPSATSRKAGANGLQQASRIAVPAQPQASKASPRPQDIGSFDFSAVGGMPSTLNNAGISKASAAALKALANEMKTLEEKKRIVEELARDLEPPSDGEDEDVSVPSQ